MLKMHVVCSEDIDGVDAARELVAKGREVLGDDTVGGMLLFTSLLDADHAAMLQIITDAFPGVALAGCTTDGEISSELGQTDDTSTLIFFVANGISFVSAVVRDLTGKNDEELKADCQQARDRMWQTLPSGSVPKLCLAFPDGLVAYQKPIVKYLGQALGAGIPLFGAAAGDDYKFVRTCQFCDGEVLTDSMPLMLITGNLTFSFGAAHGWNPVSQLARVTKSDYNKVYEIDGQPVLEYYQRYLGDILNMTPGIFAHFALIVMDLEEGGSYLRDPIYPVPEEKALIFAGEVPEGTAVRLAEIGRDDLIEAVAKSTESALASFSGEKIAGALVFSCASRRNVLGSRVGEECQLCQAKIGAGATLAGFYGFGEIAPLGNDGVSILHNDAFVVLLLGEE
jgi:hypothetical protein